MATTCSTCGEQNAPDAQFCTICRSYLGWRDPTLVQSPTLDPTSGTDGPPEVVAEPRDEKPPAAPNISAEGDPFEAILDVTETTVALEGTPATIVVSVANTSHLVDSYVVDALEGPPWLEITPGKAELLPATSGTVAIEIRIASHGLVPAQQLSLVLRVSNTTGRSVSHDLPVTITVPEVTGPIALRVEPQQLRVRDTAQAVCQVVVSNSGSNRWAQVRLSASDPEQVVQATWSAAQLQIPPGGEETTEVRFVAPPPDPGGEVIRPITILAKEGHRRAETGVVLTQSASLAAIDTVALRLDPSVLRLRGRHRGRVTAVVDNRQGTKTADLSLSGHDPEKRLRLTFSPSTVRVEPGHESSVRVKVKAPRTPPGLEVNSPLTIAVSDGHTEARAEGTVVQLASSWRGAVRILLVVLGAVLMLLGSSLTFVADTGNTAFQLTAAQIASQINSSYSNLGIPDPLNAGGIEDVVSVGLILVFLAGLMLFGLTGRAGRLTRAAALTGFVVVVATFVGATVLAEGSGPGPGAVVTGLGCVMGYVSGLMARR